MKRLIAEEEERKRLRKAEEEADRIAQEKAKQELEERQRRELEERRKALAKKRADLEEKNRRLEVNVLERCRVEACWKNAVKSVFIPERGGTAHWCSRKSENAQRISWTFNFAHFT